MIYVWWSLFYIIPSFANYPLIWKSTEEQVLFTKALLYQVPGNVEWSTRNLGWPLSYILLLMFHKLLDLDILAASLYFATMINLFIPLVIFLLGKKVSPKTALLVPLIFSIPQTYYFRYFSDYLYGFSLFLVLIYLTWTLLLGRASKNDKGNFMGMSIAIIVLFTSLVAGHPLTSIMFIILYALYSIIETLKFQNNKDLVKIFVLLLTIFISWYMYNQLAYRMTSPYIIHILNMERLTYALTPQAYIRTPYHENLSYYFLYISRYFIFALLGVTSLIGLLIMLKRNDRKALILLSLILSTLIPWLTLKATTWESFDSRFMIFGTLPVAILSAYAISSIKYKHILYVLLAFLPISFALAFFPSTFLIFAHEYEFQGGMFVAHYISKDIAIITDGFTVNFIAFYNPYIQPLTYLDEATIFNVEPTKIYIPGSSHILVRSIRQDVQAFVLHHRDPGSFKTFNQVLSNSHHLCYNSHYILAWFKT
jgi:multisubunit Na+/H+ antiporter MnhC subunit